MSQLCLIASLPIVRIRQCHSFAAEPDDIHFQQIACTIPRHISDDCGVVHIYRNGHLHSSICGPITGREVVFFRNFLAVLILLPLLARVGFGVLHMHRPKLFFLRAAVNSVGMFCGFTALTMIPLAQMTALQLYHPIICNNRRGTISR